MSSLVLFPPFVRRGFEEDPADEKENSSAYNWRKLFWACLALSTLPGPPPGEERLLPDEERAAPVGTPLSSEETWTAILT